MTIRSEASPMQIEILYFDDCPNHLPTVERINAVLREEGCRADVREVLVPDVSTAQRVNFLGSPTVRVNGIDIEPAANDRKDFGLMCRRYAGGVPSHELIRAAVRSASHLRRSRAMKQVPVVIGSSLGAIASGLVATVTTFCCVGPAVIAILGTSGVIAAARLAPYRPYFILGSVLLLGLGFWLAYRPKGGCVGKTCTTTSAKITRVLLWIAALVTGAAILLPNFVGG